jgi:DNA-directed RNA polymerase specialized sigma24 family protein
MKAQADGLSAVGLSRLLARLDPDPERAGALYEDLRRTLVKFFDWRGSCAPDEGADETLDRLAGKLADGDVVEEPRSYARGIARLVLLEQWRRPALQASPANERELDRIPAPDPPEAGAAGACLERCLAELPPGSRELILEYYAAEGRAKIDNRRRLAAALGLSETALRSRAQRLRDRLERCVARSKPPLQSDRDASHPGCRGCRRPGPETPARALSASWS